MELVKISAKEFGIPENKAKEISKMFKPMLDKMVALENEFNEIQQTNMSPELCKKARELRLRYVRVRTGTAEIHKELKDFYLKGGRFVDGWKNAQLMASQGVEKKLSEIENYYELQEQKRISDLQEERAAELEEIGSDFIPDNLGTMEPKIWENYLLGQTEAIRIRKEAETKAEIERIEKERREKLHEERKNQILDLWSFVPDDRKDEDLSVYMPGAWDDFVNNLKKNKAKHERKQEEIRLENERLRKERVKAELKLKKEKEQLDKNAEILGGKLKASGYEFDQQTGNYKKYDLVFVNHEQLKTISMSSLEASIIANDRLIKDRKELEEKKRQEEEAERIRKANIEENAKKGDKDKFSDLLHELDAVVKKYEFKSDQYNKLYENLLNLLSEIFTQKNEIE